MRKIETTSCHNSGCPSPRKRSGLTVSTGIVLLLFSSIAFPLACFFGVRLFALPPRLLVFFRFARLFVGVFFDMAGALLRFRRVGIREINVSTTGYHRSRGIGVGGSIMARLRHPHHERREGKKKKEVSLTRYKHERKTSHQR